MLLPLLKSFLISFCALFSHVSSLLQRLWKGMPTYSTTIDVDLEAGGEPVVGPVQESHYSTPRPCSALSHRRINPWIETSFPSRTPTDLTTNVLSPPNTPELFQSPEFPSSTEEGSSPDYSSDSSNTSVSHTSEESINDGVEKTGDPTLVVNANEIFNLIFSVFQEKNDVGAEEYDDCEAEQRLAEVAYSSRVNVKVGEPSFALADEANEASNHGRLFFSCFNVEHTCSHCSIVGHRALSKVEGPEFIDDLDGVFSYPASEYHPPFQEPLGCFFPTEPIIGKPTVPRPTQQRSPH